MYIKHVPIARKKIIRGKVLPARQNWIAIKNRQLRDISQNPRTLNLTENTCTHTNTLTYPRSIIRRDTMVKQHKCLSYQCFTVDIQTNITLEVTRLIMTKFFPYSKEKAKNLWVHYTIVKKSSFAVSQNQRTSSTPLSLSFVNLSNMPTYFYMYYLKHTYHGLHTAWHCHWEG